MSTKLLSEIDLTDIMTRTASDHPELSAAGLEEAEDDYRRFLLLCCHYLGTPISPTARADIVWHTHILFTERYQNDCAALFGKFLHHRPFTAVTKTETKHESAENLRRLWLKHYGFDPLALGNGSMLAGECEPSSCQAPVCGTESNSNGKRLLTGECDTQSCEALPACDNGPDPSSRPIVRIFVPELPLAGVAAN